nr:hypothetical protein [Tanacetum cinerariifolium]
MRDEHLSTISKMELDEDIDYVEASPPDSELVNLEEVQDDILRKKLLNINLLIAKIESLIDNSTPDCVLKSPSPFPIPHPEVALVQSPTNKLLQTSYDPSRLEMFINNLDHCCCSFLVTFPPNIPWQILYPNTLETIIQSSSNIIERSITKFVQFINLHQPILLVFILIDESSWIGVSSVGFLALQIKTSLVPCTIKSWRFLLLLKPFRMLKSFYSLAVFCLDLDPCVDLPMVLVALFFRALVDSGSFPSLHLLDPRPQLKSNPQGDRVLRSNSRGKKLEVEEHRRNVKLPKNKTSVTACNDSLNAKTVNVKSISMRAKCVMSDKHDLCVLNSVAKPLKKTVASKSNKKPRNNVRKLHKRFGKIYKWSYIKFTPLGYMWKPKSPKGNVNPNVNMPLGNASRAANVKDTMTSRRFIVSNTPLSSNSFADHRDFSIYRRLWVLKAHDGKSQASN